MKNNVWFVTGASKGLGLALVKKLLQQGFKVAATSRSVTDLEAAVGAGKDVFLPLAMDVTNESSVEDAIWKTVSYFGGIDVVVNNAGFGLLGALEELSDAEARQNFEINVFGALNVIRKAMPYLRKQQSGHIFNISSIGGFSGMFPGFGVYCSTKFALDGLSESLYCEVKPFGVRVTIVSPGYFRTNFLSAASLAVPQNQMPEYASVRESQAAHQTGLNGNQPGDPDKAADVMIAVSGQQNPPLHLFLGADAYATADAKIKLVESDMASVKAIATATGFE